MKKLIALTVALTLTNAAFAVEYNRLLVEKSAIGFAYKQMNVPMKGHFNRFNGDIRFDPAKPAKGSARLNIDLTSIDTGALDANLEVREKLWLNTQGFPQAQFISTAIKSAGPNRFDVSGKLTIKGKTRDVIAPVSVRQDGGNVMLDGALVIKRADFAIGEGFWADFDAVANEVEVTFRLLATSVPGKK